MKPAQLSWLPYFAVAAAALVLSACSEGQANSNAQGENAPLSRVLVVEVQAQTLELERSFAARTEGSMVAEVKARASGLIEGREFSEGQLINANDIMFRLEKAPYEVTLQRARADLSQAEARHSAAQRDWNRVSNLYEDGAISGRERDQAQSELEMAEAELESARASLDDAQLRYNYTDVKAPITGIASREMVSAGNVIEEGSILAVVTALDPLHVRFSVPENDVAARYLLQNTALTGTVENAPRARLAFTDGRQHPMEGHIDYVSRVVDRETGSMEARAVIPNPQMDLLPGQFVRVKLPRISLPNAILVPQRAIVQSGRRSVVYIADSQDIVRVREVTLGVRVDSQQLIEEGLSSGDRVIVEGLTMLQPGSRVRVEAIE